MKIKEILNLDIDSFAIASVDKSEVISVGPIKESENGQYQIITVDNDGYDIKLRLKSKNHFLPEDYEGNIKVMSGKPVRGKPVGIIFRLIKGKPSVNITENATLVLSASGEEDPKHNVELSAPELNKEVAGVNYSAGEGTVSLGITNPSLELKVGIHQEEGPSDSTIIECFHERLHVLNILKNLNQKNNLPFTIDSLYPMVTSIIIDAGRAGKRILPLAPHVSKKKKFDPYEKPHNPPREEAKPEVSMNPEKNPVNDYLLTRIKTPEYLTLDAKNNAVGDVMTFRDRRVKAVSWMLKAKINDTDLSKNLFQMYYAIKKLVDDAPGHIRNHMLYEAMAYTEDPENKDEVEVMTNLAEEHGTSDPMELAQIVFTAK